MRKVLLGLFGSLVLSLVTAGAASAATPSTSTVPMAADMAKLRPFSAEASYMSLPGYFRYLLHLATGQWLTYEDAVHKVQGAVTNAQGS